MTGLDRTWMFMCIRVIRINVGISLTAYCWYTENESRAVYTTSSEIIWTEVAQLQDYLHQSTFEQQFDQRKQIKERCLMPLLSRPASSSGTLFLPESRCVTEHEFIGTFEKRVCALDAVEQYSVTIGLGFGWCCEGVRVLYLFCWRWIFANNNCS